MSSVFTQGIMALSTWFPTMMISRSASKQSDSVLENVDPLQATQVEMLYNLALFRTDSETTIVCNYYALPTMKHTQVFTVVDDFNESVCGFDLFCFVLYREIRENIMEKKVK